MGNSPHEIALSMDSQRNGLAINNGVWLRIRSNFCTAWPSYSIFCARQMAQILASLWFRIHYFLPIIKLGSTMRRLPQIDGPTIASWLILAPIYQGALPSLVVHREQITARGGPQLPRNERVRQAGGDSEVSRCFQL